MSDFVFLPYCLIAKAAEKERFFCLSTNQEFFSSKCYPFVSCLSHEADFKMKLL